MSTVLITGARAPAALELARLFDIAGHRVVLADSLHRPAARRSRAARAFIALPSPRYDDAAFGPALAEAVTAHAVDLIVPTCEEVFHLARVAPSYGLDAMLFAPSLARLAELHDKHAFIRLCARLSLDVPRTERLASERDLDRLRNRSRDLVFKPVWSRFATRVMMRLAPHALSRVRPTSVDPWVAQEVLEGTELSVYAVARGGRVVALSTYRGLFRAGPGAAVCFAPADVPEVAGFVRRVVAGTNWTGQISFDLMQLADGRVLPLECNPRATSGVHFFRGPDLAGAILGDRSEAVPNVERPQGVRLALWLYGLPQAVTEGRPGDFRRALRNVEDVFDAACDPIPLSAQFGALSEIVQVALRRRVGLRRAATEDIEWNGPCQSHIR